MKRFELAPNYLLKGIYPLLILTLALNFFAWGISQDVQASTIIKVNSTQDSLANDGRCTLREAVISANRDIASGKKPGECKAGSGADVIQIPAGMVVSLTKTDNGGEDASASGDLDILGDITIEGMGPGAMIRGAEGYSDHILQIHTGNVSLRNLTLLGGASGTDGGGIHNKATLTIEKTTITGNAAEGRGGGIYNASTGRLTVVNSTLSGNLSQASGGAVYNDGIASLNNVTLTSNIAVMGGGGVAAQVGSLSIWNSILAGNLDRSSSSQSPDCAAALASAGYLLVGSQAGCSFNSDAPNILSGIDPLLGPLQDNGGGTWTHALLDGSPAVDAANRLPPGSGGNACAAFDQRGANRPRGAACDMGAFETGTPNSSVLIRAFPIQVSSQTVTRVVGRLTSSAGMSFSIQFYAGGTCHTDGSAVGDPVQITTNTKGVNYFNITLSGFAAVGDYLWAVTYDPQGTASLASSCIRVSQGNDSWPEALRLYPDNVSTNYQDGVDEYLDLPGQSRWYKFTAHPNSKLVVWLTELPENYDLVLYKNIAQAYQSLNSPEDLLRLGAEFAPEAFSPEAFSPEAFSPEAFSPEAFSPEAFSPEAFSPEAFSPEAFSPEAFSPEAFSPEAFSPDAFSPEAFSPEAFSPEAFSPEAFSPEAFSPEAFSSAQTSSLIGISAFNGLAGEGLMINTWDVTGDFYIRVRGRNGAYNPDQPYHLVVSQVPGLCAGISSSFPASTILPAPGLFRTLVLANLDAVEGSSADKAALLSRLQEFIARPEVSGVLINLGQDARFDAARTQALQNPACPYAMNLAAGTAKEVVDAYWALNPSLQYLVILGNDEVIPFFRHPDHALLGNESQFVPPVKDNTTSQASLKLGYVLSQDDYGARLHISSKENTLPLPELAVGRLVETAAEMTGMLDAYLSTQMGVVDTPVSGFVSGYDFLEDAANNVAAQLQAGLSTDGSAAVTTLISAQGLSPSESWSADQLKAALFTQRYDLVFLAGHFSASSMLAADFTTRILTRDLLASEVDLRNALVYSAGCHSGYNIVNSHDVPWVTREPDWAQAFARKQATLVAGTGYQYGDTDFLRYSEQLYRNFTAELRMGNGPVAIGEALVRAKQDYLAETPYLGGIDEKAVLEATLFGLPMLSIDLPGERLDPVSKPSRVTETNLFPGAKLGLEYYDLNLNIPEEPGDLQQISVDMTKVQDWNLPAEYMTASYYVGPDGVAAEPNRPVLPLFQYNVSVPDKVLRGVGFRSGAYTDLAGVLPFTSAPAIEVRGVHIPFQTAQFFPVQTWLVNYFSALAGDGILLNVLPVQYQALPYPSIASTERLYSRLGYRLFYNSNIATYGSATSGAGSTLSTPALAAAPAIVRVTSQVVDYGVHFQAQVVGNPAAGIEEVWLTYTALNGSLYGVWQSLDLTQDPLQSTLWEGDLLLTDVAPQDVLYIVQAVNGIGLVSMHTNQGSYYIPGVEPGSGDPTSLSLIPASGSSEIPTQGTYAAEVTFSARLESSGAPLAGKAIAFTLGPQSRLAMTDEAGLATVTLSLYASPGEHALNVAFAGDAAYLPAYDSQPFSVERQFTQITLVATDGYPEDTRLLAATLQDISGRYLAGETLIFILRGKDITYLDSAITNYSGTASLGSLPLPPGDFTVEVYFNGTSLLEPSFTLVDDRYEPAAYLDGSLTLLSHSPQAVDDLYQVFEDGLLVVPAPGVLSNDRTPGGIPLSASLLTGPAYGSLAFSADGAFTYTPQANFSGTDSFTYQAVNTDGIAAATVAIQVQAVNDAPSAAGETYTQLEDATLSIPAPGVLANDADVDGDVLTPVLVSGPYHGELILYPDGAFTYTPQAGFTGSDEFIYQASDGYLFSQPVVVTMQVEQANQPPVCSAAAANPNIIWTPNKQFVRVDIANLTDTEGDPFRIAVTGVRQDEPVGNQPDAYIFGYYVTVRAERDGNGDGRAYHIYFIVTDNRGASCTGDVVIVVVLHDQSGDPVVHDDGPIYDSTLAK